MAVKKKITVTINTDASFSQKHRVGGYAFWIASNTGRIKRSGLLKNANQPLEAEIMAIGNGLYMLLHSKIAGFERLLINTDCTAAIDDIKRVKPRLPCSANVRRLLTEIREKFHFADDSFYEFRHVKAHLHTNTPRHYVNAWCDRESRKHVHEQTSGLHTLKLKTKEHNGIT